MSALAQHLYGRQAAMYIDKTKEPHSLTEAREAGWNDDTWHLFEVLPDLPVLWDCMERCKACTCYPDLNSLLRWLYVSSPKCGDAKQLRGKKFIDRLRPFIEADLHNQQRISKNFRDLLQREGELMKAERGENLKRRRAMTDEYSAPQALQGVNSALMYVVQGLAAQRERHRELMRQDAFSYTPPEAKIELNGLQQRAADIRRNVGLGHELLQLYKAADEQGDSLHGDVVDVLTDIYLTLSGAMTDGRQLYEAIEGNAYNIVSGSGNRGSLTQESIMLGVKMVVANAFADCDIMKKTAKEDTTRK